MGSRSVRITREDFLIPHEFQGCRLAEGAAGHVGGTRLDLVRSAGNTVLGGCYQQTPLRVLPAFHFPGEPAALLYLINPTTGLLDGDGHLISVVAGESTCAVITGQSATRVHPAVSSFATQQWDVRVRSGARLVVLPGPNIPFRGCRYHQRIRIHLEGDARLIWGDIWTPGRYVRVGGLAEHHQFERIVQDMEVRREGNLVYRERFTWDGPWDIDSARWYVGQGGDAGSASLFVTGEASSTALALDPVEPDAPPAVRRATLPLDAGDTLVRWCGPARMLAPAVVHEALTRAGGWTPDAGPARWLIDGHHLNPSHWFFAQEAQNAR